ncbi:MAG: hypothetical protein F4Z00_12430 [Acidimicrobiaceae bacterium]|nr:hypothetical protein [Acidimicrobiaceae bacterium]MXZ66334.1 hypothetical protein [Acidimicrobiaceae bacterium]MYF32308.1 hypothetical protein [Acidimicrobiaceae bacterium]MYG77531.1 hypothetical protein [Acidimicrobiaceae bacterium]
MTAIPEDPTADTDEDTVDALFQDFGDRPGVFDAGDAQAAFDKALQEHKKQLEAEGGTYKPGDKIPRKVLAQALCTGLESCDDSVSVDDQIVQLYGDPDEHADEGSGITAGYGNRPDNSEESLIDDFGGENTASNGHIVAFLSRIDEIAAGGNGGDSDNSGGNHGNSGNYGNSGGNHGNSGNSGNTGSTPQTPSVRPVVSLSPQSRTVDEDSATTTFTVRLSRSSSQTATVIFFTEDGTATSGDDYEARAALVRFDPGETRAPVEVTIHNDPIHENNETFTARLALPQNANLSSSRSTVTIRDDDPAGFVGAVTNLTGQCVDGQITVSWSPPSSGVVDEYRYNIWDHPAMVGGRYGNRVATGTTTTNTYATATAPDPTVTYYAEVQARGGANPNQAGWLPTGGFTCTESLPVVSLDDTTLDVTEGQAVTIYASLTKAPSGTAHVWLSPPSANGGTIGPCTSSSDWAIDEGRFRFLGRSTSASITFTACPDSDTVDETVTLSLTTIDINGLALGEPHTIRVTITIIDNGTGGGQGGQDGWRV